MAIQRWQPFSELMSLRQAMDRLFEDSFVRPSRVLTTLGEAAAPALDVYQTPNEVVVKTAEMISGKSHSQAVAIQ